MIRRETKPRERSPDPSPTVGGSEFAAQFQSSFRVLWLIAVGITGDRWLAEDVVQEAAIIALNKLDQFQAGTNFTAWTGQIVRNVALNSIRKERRHRTSPIAASEAEPVGTASVEGFGGLKRPEFDDRVLRALGDVGEIARACLLLRTLEGLEYTEISRLLEIPEGTAMSHVHRTRQYLRDRLADVWKEQEEQAREGPR